MRADRSDVPAGRRALFEGGKPRAKAPRFQTNACLPPSLCWRLINKIGNEKGRSFSWSPFFDCGLSIRELPKLPPFVRPGAAGVGVGCCLPKGKHQFPESFFPLDNALFELFSLLFLPRFFFVAKGDDRFQMFVQLLGFLLPRFLVVLKGAAHGFRRSARLLAEVVELPFDLPHRLLDGVGCLALDGVDELVFYAGDELFCYVRGPMAQQTGHVNNFPFHHIGFHRSRWIGGPPVHLGDEIRDFARMAAFLEQHTDLTKSMDQLVGINARPLAGAGNGDPLSELLFPLFQVAGGRPDFFRCFAECIGFHRIFSSFLVFWH